MPPFRDDGTEQTPYWQRQVEAVARELASLPPDAPLILVAHSGAGPLLPAMRKRLPHAVAGYIFVDAGLPRDGASRLGEMEESSPDFASSLREDLEAGGVFPTWTDEDLHEVIPDDQRRSGILAELQPRPLAFFTEPIPVFGGWPDAACAYLRLSAAYTQPATAARRAGWMYGEFDAGHFHMLVDPQAVMEALVDFATSMGCTRDSGKAD